jgi:hypothetical protein
VMPAKSKRIGIDSTITEDVNATPQASL